MSCHREDNAKGDIRLDTKEATLAGDDVLVPGDPESSSLYWTTTLPLDDELIMPPIKNKEKDYPLTEDEQAVLKQWILDGGMAEDIVRNHAKIHENFLRRACTAYLRVALCCVPL